MTKYKYLTFLLIILISCKSSKENDININLADSNQDLRYSQFVDKINYIKLRDSSSFVSEIEQLFWDDSLIFVLDKKQKTIFEFDVYGNLHAKICSIGKGPGEYIVPESISIDKINDLIYIYDPRQHKFLVYFFNGTFQKEIAISTGDIFDDFHLLENGDFILLNKKSSDNTINGIWESDSILNFKKQLIESNPFHNLPIYQFPLLCVYENQISFYNIYTNQVFDLRILNSSLKYNIKLNEQVPDKILKESKIEIESGKVKNLSRYKNYVFNSFYCENEIAMFIKYNSPAGGNYYVYFNKRDKNILKGLSLKNDIDNLEPTNRFFPFMNNKLITLVPEDSINYNMIFQILCLKENL